MSKKIPNPGMFFASQAAASIGGAAVIMPPYKADWNDVAVFDGLDAVRSAFKDAWRVSEPEPEWEPHYDEVGPTWDETKPLDRIKPLGHDRGTFYFFPKATGQIMEYSATALAQPANLYAMAPRHFWDQWRTDDKMSSRQIADNASADLIQECHNKGIFNPDNSRGVGFWRDEGRLVVNTGEEVICNGERCKPQDFKGKAVYESGQLVYDVSAEPLRNKEAAAFRDICRRFNWRQSIMGDLLAGFCVLAPIGGVLKWRPHAVVTGEKGSGKSTLIDNVVKAIIGDCGIFLDGGTTEAGMRKEIGLSARPVVMDEGESETKKSREAMEGIFFLARKSSSGSRSATAYGRVNVRSCFCIAAINPRIVQGPDKDRWSTLELIKNNAPDAQDKWKALEIDLRRVITEDYSKALLARTIKNLEVLLHNIEVFRFAAAKALGDARSGDQLGPLIAGAFSLTSDRKVDEDFASAWIAKQDWQWRDADVDIPEHEKFLATVLTMRLRYDREGMGRESDIGSMVVAASNPSSMTHIDAVDGLKQIGVKVEGGRIIFANSSPKLSHMLKDTVWSDWKRILMKFEGADNCGNKSVRFGNGINTKATSIPLYHATGEVPEVEGEEVPFEDGF